MRSWRENNLLREETSRDEYLIVGFYDFAAALKELQLKYRDTQIEIYNMNADYDEPIQLGLNWDAAGDVDADKALKFASDVIQAAKDCKNFKYDGYVVKKLKA